MTSQHTTRSLCVLASLVTISTGTRVHAQTSTVEQSGLSILVDSPTGNDGGRIDCSSTQEDSCTPINAASCDFNTGLPASTETRPFDVQLTSSGNVPVNSRLLAFLTTDSDCVFAQESDIDAPINSEQLINTSDPLVTNEAFNFPADFGNNDYNNVADILEASGACATPVDQSQQRLCFVASSNDDIAESGEPYAAVLLLIDTVPPDPPSSLEVLPRDGSIEVNIDTDEAAILSWSIRFRPEVGDEASCDTWGDEATTRERVIATQFDQSFTESVENGVTYEVCVFAQDEAGNTGDVSDTVVVTPQDECDFIECFPGDFDDGCSASGGSLATLLALLALVRRRRKEVRS